MKCTATSRRSQEQCRNNAIPGAVVCRWHGGKAGAVAQNAEVRATLAQLLRQDPRPVGEVLLDATHLMDSLMRDASTALREGERLTADQLDRLVEAAKAAHHMAKVTIDAGVSTALVREMERHEQMEGEVIGRIFETLLHALLDALGLDPSRRRALERWAQEAALTALRSIEVGSDANPTVPPPPLQDVAIGVVVEDDRPGASTESPDAPADAPTTDPAIARVGRRRDSAGEASRSQTRDPWTRVPGRELTPWGRPIA